MQRRDVLKTAIAAAAAKGLPPLVREPRPGGPEAFQAARRWASVPGGRVAFVERGSGPAALFLHGWPLNGYHWRGALDRLAAVRRCIAPDFLGLGYSEADDSADLSPEAQARTIVALLDTLAIDAADIVANDSGTAVAQLIAARWPGRVRSLLLTNGDVHTNSPPAALAPAIAAARAGQLDDIIELHLTRPGFAASPQGLGGICYTDPANLTADAMATYFRPLLATPGRRAQFQAYGVAFEPNPLPALEDALRACDAPARMLWGTGDIHFAPEWADWLDRRLPNSRGVRLVAGAKLFFTEEYPDLVAEEAKRLWGA